MASIQYAMNLRLRDEGTFWAAYQNQPLHAHLPDDGVLTARQIVAKVNGMQGGEAPMELSHVVAVIDVHATLLHRIVVGWEDESGRYILDYGA